MGLEDMFLGALALGGIEIFQDCNEMNKQKIQEAEKKYWDACKYPRKKKKKMRKEALRDYSFWVSIDKWYQKEFEFLKK